MTTSPPQDFTFVLGSGGVKSIAGLGAMEVFMREGLRPAALAGCSAGAIFAAVIASGVPVREAIRMATSLWTAEITGRRRHRALLEIAMPRWAGFGEGFALRDDRAIGQRLHAAFGTARIEDLPLPLRIQATDAASGAAVVLQRGRLDEALRASVALPFLFAPQRVDGRLLVDGSLSDPLPIGGGPQGQPTVALGFRVPFPRSADSASRLATRVTATLSNNLLDARLAAADRSRLVLMLPETDRRIGLFDTDAMPYLLDLGRRAAEAALPRLHSLLHAPVRFAKVA